MSIDLDAFVLESVPEARPEQARAVLELVLGRARDLADARLLLEALGFLPGPVHPRTALGLRSDRGRRELERAAGVRRR